MEANGDEFDTELRDVLLSVGVRQAVLDKLQEDELNTAEILENSSYELLKACGVKGGQVVLLRKGLNLFKNSMQGTSETQTVDTVLPTPPPVTTTDPPSPPPLSPYPHPKVAFGPGPQRNNNWINHFELPSVFSPDATTELSKNMLSSNRRNEFTRDICSAVRIHTIYPSKTEREQVALMVTKKYPFLADKLGTAIGSWQEAMTNRFKNLRKCKRPAATSESAVAQDSTATAKKTSRNATVTEMQEGETEETCKDHVLNMKREMANCSNRNAGLLKELMEIRFPYRRRVILMEPVVVKLLLTKYPKINLFSIMFNLNDLCDFQIIINLNDIRQESQRSFIRMSNSCNLFCSFWVTFFFVSCLVLYINLLNFMYT